MIQSTKTPFWKKLVENRAIFGYMVFWVYNLTFIAFIGLGFGPIVLPSIIQGVRAGFIPGFFVAFGVIIIAVPVIASILGITVLRKHIGKLFLLGYGIEGPLMLILGVRFFGIGQATTPIRLVMIVAIIGLVTLLWHILDPRYDQRDGFLGYAKAFGMACLVLIGLYASLWVLFFAFPIGRLMIEGLFEILRNIPNFFQNLIDNFWLALQDGFFFVLFGLFGGLIFLFSATLFILLPLVVPWLYVKAWLAGNRGIGHAKAAAVLVAVVAAVGIGFAVTDRQPQAEAFAMLQNDPTTKAEAVALLNQSDEIRAGLLNSYLARTRYLTSISETNLRYFYADAFESMEDETTIRIQTAFETVARPFLYQPHAPLELIDNSSARWNQPSRLNSEPDEAARLYEKFFDRPINEGEKEQVVRAVRTTWDPAQAERAWQAVDDREVRLEEQHLTHTYFDNGIHGFELHEVYSNRTSQRQEVVYYFSLPETAVITGVWLGDETGKVFEYQVAPRGAAQQVYQEQVQRNVDPALVEQIGPQQYRLRIFPIEPLRQRFEGRTMTPTIEEGEDMHVWLKWQVIGDDEVVPMPKMSVLRNVFSDDETVRTVTLSGWDEAVTLEEDVWQMGEMNVGWSTGQPDMAVKFPGGRMVVAERIDPQALPQLPAGLSFAVVLDRSFSMNELSDEVEAALAELTAVNPNADVYLTASEFRGEAPSVNTFGTLTADDLIYFGGQNSAEIMAQFSQLNSGVAYDAIIVLTDDGTFSTTANQTETVAVPNAPVWMIHLGGVLPNGYDDNTLEIVQASGGGAAVTLDGAFSRLAVFLSGDQSDVVDGYRWTVYRAGGEPDLPADIVMQLTDSPFAKIAARQLILAEMRANRGKITDVALLDQLHIIAVDQAIVTPFSSMIVLVNDFQQKRLEELSEKGDRFDREVEEIGDTVAPGPTVTGVPEPEEWLLIILSAGMLLWYLWRKKQGKQLAPTF